MPTRLDIGDGSSTDATLPRMASEKYEQPTQATQPKGVDPKTGKPYEPVQIPVPKVSTFRAAIRKVAQPDRHGDKAG